MNKEEETTTRVTRGALRRRSVDQDTSTGIGTPKKASVAKKTTVLNAIQEKTTSTDTPTSNADVAESIKTHKDTPAVNSATASKASVTRLRSRTTSLTEENLAMWDELSESRRTPRRRPSQDITPQTAPQSNRRMTRRNSATSEDAQIMTPIASRSRLSVAPPTIAEDDEKEDKINSSTPEADLSDLDVRKLRNRSISNSPVPRTSPSVKNTPSNSQPPADDVTHVTPKEAKVLLTDIVEKKSPLKSPSSDANFSLKATEDHESSMVKQPSTPIPADHADTTQTDSGNKQQSKNVTFDEKSTLEWQNQSSYPKTPIATGERKGFRFVRGSDDSPTQREASKATPEMFEIAETDSDSPSKPDDAMDSKPTIIVVGPGAEAGAEPQQLDRSMDASLANIVEDVKENLNRADQSVSILDTPRPMDKLKSRLPELREVQCSTPLTAATETAVESAEKSAAKADIIKDDTEKNNSSLSKSWSKAVKGSSTDKGIDVFSVRKQEAEERQDEEAKKLNESLKRKSLDRSKNSEEQVEEEDDEEDECIDAEHNSFVEDEAIEVNDYNSGDSLDSDMQDEMDRNEIVEEGESIGSRDSEDDENAEDEEDENDSFIVDDEDEHSLLAGSGDDLDDEPAIKKKRSRIIQQDDTSDEEDNLVKKDTSKNRSTAEISLSSPTREPVVLSNSPEKSSKKAVTQSPQKTDSEQNSPEKKKRNSLDKKKAATETVALSQKTAVPKSRKSMPAPALVSADFYTSSSKKQKRNTINVLAPEETEPADEPVQKTSKRKSVSNLVANPAALVQAKKHKRLTLDSASDNVLSKSDKRSSLPGKLPEDKELSFLQKTKSGKFAADEPPAQQEEIVPEPPVEPMEVDEDPVEEQPEQPEEDAKPTKDIKKQPKDLSEFDHDAILSRCNEIVRADKEKRKLSATLRQKKKDEKRRQREQQQTTESTDANDESLEPSKKKKKKKKKQINYLLEELGEPKENQLAKALQRRAALLEARKLRKKAKKAAKLQRQLNKENQQDDQQPKGGIAAKFEKKEKKKNNQDNKLISLITSPTPVEPKVKVMVSAFAAYSAQIEELKAEQKSGKKKNKQLKEKNHQRSPIQEVQKALDTKTNKESKSKKSKDKADVPVAVPTQESDANTTSKQTDKKSKEKKKTEPAENSIPKNNMVEEATKIEQAEKPAKSDGKPQHSKEKPLKHTKSDTAKAAPIDLDEQLAKLKASLSEPIQKVLKKQKLSQKDFAPVQQISVEMTPPRKTASGKKLKLLSRLESAGGFVEEPMTPEQQLLKRNLGFKEEPVTPKPLGFRVSKLLPAGQEELRSLAVATKKMKKYSQSNRIRPEDVVEPVKTLPLPIWTRSGTFEVEDINNTKKKHHRNYSDCLPLKTGSCKVATQFMVKTLPPGKHVGGADTGKKHLPRQIEQVDAEPALLNLKKQAILGKNAHLREKKSKH